MRFAVLCLTLVSLAATAPTAAQDIPESSPQAMAHYAKGIEHYVRSEYNEAVRHFEMALAEDPTFYLAILMAATSHSNAGRVNVADSLYRVLAPHRHRLSPYYQARLDAQVAAREGNMGRAVELMRNTMQESPGTKAAYNLALWASNTNRPREALAALRTLDPEREPMRGWIAYVTVYAGAAHAAGEYEDELHRARHSRTLFPGDIRTANLEALALATNGRVDELGAVLDEVSGMATIGTTSPGVVMTSAAQELAAHGHEAASKAVFERSLAWFDALSAEQASNQTMRANRAYLLYAMGRNRDAATAYAALAKEFPANGTYAAWSGILAGMQRNRRQANQVAADIGSGAITMTPANRSTFRALLAASVGETDKAVALFQEGGVRGRWMHRDPLLRATLMKNPAFVAFLQPEG